MPRLPRSAPGRTRTDTERFLRPLPLPLGYEGGRRGQHGAAWRRLKDRSCAGRSRAPRRPGRGTAARRSGRSRAAARGPRTPPRSTSTSSPVPGSWPRTTQPGGPLHVAGEVRDAHAALAGLLVAGGLHHHGVAQHEGAVVAAGLGVLAHVDAEHLRAHADLRRGEPDAARGDPHGGDQVGGELHRPPARSGRPASPTLDSTVAGARDHLEHPPRRRRGRARTSGRRRRRRTQRSQLVALHLAAGSPRRRALGGRRGERLLERADVGAGGEVDLGDRGCRARPPAGW